MTARPSVPAWAWSELLHAQVAHQLARAGIRVLHIKGPTVATWLYGDGERAWGDVDVLVPPDCIDTALDVLISGGLQERFPGVTASASGDHAVTLAHVDPGSPDAIFSEIDVHHRFEGVGDEPAAAFEEFWRRREPARLGHVDVWFPDLTTRALLVALNVARTDTPRSREDLRRLVESAQEDDWRDLIALARLVDALPALRAGLETDSGGRAVVAATALSDVPVSAEWALRTGGANRTALRLEELHRMPWRRRFPAIARWLLPSPAIIRMRDPAARGNVLRLAAGYVRRLGDGLGSIVPSLRALGALRSRKGSGDDETLGER